MTCVKCRQFAETVDADKLCPFCAAMLEKAAPKAAFTFVERIGDHRLEYGAPTLEGLKALIEWHEARAKERQK